MLASAQGPLASPVCAFTHRTGSPWTAAIICLTRTIMLTPEPAATLAASLVPRAITQQPRNPAPYHALAIRQPFCWPGNSSTTDRPPEVSIHSRWTPTPRYCAASRWAASGSHCGETIPTEVESPMCATAVHEVRGSAASAAGGGAATERPCRGTAAAALRPDKTPTAVALMTAIARTAMAAASKTRLRRRGSPFPPSRGSALLPVLGRIASPSRGLLPGRTPESADGIPVGGPVCSCKHPGETLAL